MEGWNLGLRLLDGHASIKVLIFVYSRFKQYQSLEGIHRASADLHVIEDVRSQNRLSGLGQLSMLRRRRRDQYATVVLAPKRKR
jgi:hypothetical protein